MYDTRDRTKTRDDGQMGSIGGGGGTRIIIINQCCTGLHALIISHCNRVHTPLGKAFYKMMAIPPPLSLHFLLPSRYPAKPCSSLIRSAEKVSLRLVTSLGIPSYKITYTPPFRIAYKPVRRSHQFDMDPRLANPASGSLHPVPYSGGAAR